MLTVPVNVYRFPPDTEGFEEPEPVAYLQGEVRETESAIVFDLEGVWTSGEMQVGDTMQFGKETVWIERLICTADRKLVRAYFSRERVEPVAEREL